MQKVLNNWNHSENLARLGVKSAMGVLITGSSGKTMMAYAMASSAKFNVIQLNAYFICTLFIFFILVQIFSRSI